MILYRLYQWHTLLPKICALQEHGLSLSTYPFDSKFVLAYDNIVT